MPYLRLADRVLLRKFGDNYYAYHAEKDELYELDSEAFNFLFSCRGYFKELDEEILDYLLSENLVEISSEYREIDFYHQDEPSLRYLLVSVTNVCNLSCKHCYVEKRSEFMDFEVFKKAVDEFYIMGGLKLIISGGEPLMHPRIFDFLRYAKNYPLRIVLLTNGYLLKDSIIERLPELVDEVQISLDGFEGHEKLRGASWKRVLEVVEKLSELVDVSISTMITKYNTDEFEKMKETLLKMKIKKWSIDVPTTTEPIIPDWNTIKEIMSEYGFGEKGHESVEDFACGAHYCEVTPAGDVVKCGFFEESAGNVIEGLDKCWENLRKKYIWKVSDLNCNCEYKSECKGGCRYRALIYSGDLFGEDPVMCHLFEFK